MEENKGSDDHSDLIQRIWFENAQNDQVQWFLKQFTFWTNYIVEKPYFENVKNVN